ncbi:MAG: hypothetical protein ACD_42C00488G0001 [uncultured bacterium]|nr:MAG: hypothetical protein ACD_42C00488G0001 [uncultured bacterium]OGT32356.1 MAG: hypothetical protein A3C44_06840 [Gammaproteobacteria bacterium RIFCSPHIGHO2_02_FULL_39_13]OGT48151.1 MAG: hypothetical protein A3E53_03055 [Gammaproteobacteria bacterium RIFCSPHIGHO2_12_FULL_39_24]
MRAVFFFFAAINLVLQTLASGSPAVLSALGHAGATPGNTTTTYPPTSTSVPNQHSDHSHHKLIFFFLLAVLPLLILACNNIFGNNNGSRRNRFLPSPPPATGDAALPTDYLYGSFTSNAANAAGRGLS